MAQGTPEARPGFQMADIAPENQARRGWSLAVNGKVVPDVQRVELSNPNFGILTYGWRPEGYDAPVFEENGGGGAVALPYYIDEDVYSKDGRTLLHEGNGHLYIGGVDELRLGCTDGLANPVWNVCRGFINPGETHFEAASREQLEERGHRGTYETLADRLEPLTGLPMNANSAFFVTGEGRGIHSFAMRVHHYEVLPNVRSDDPEVVEFLLDPEIIRPVSRIATKLSRARFMHWRRAVREVDMFTSAVIARLLADQVSSDTSHS